ncbi:MAG: hypothetical protein K6C40_09640, partial [Thermoguttaceae bacterium]|nr:hypothetical protein [Thermoguttaceae bacterium]
MREYVLHRLMNNEKRITNNEEFAGTTLPASFEKAVMEAARPELRAVNFSASFGEAVIKAARPELRARRHQHFF